MLRRATEYAAVFGTMFRIGGHTHNLLMRLGKGLGADMLGHGWPEVPVNFPPHTARHKEQRKTIVRPKNSGKQCPGALNAWEEVLRLQAQ